LAIGHQVPGYRGVTIGGRCRQRCRGPWQPTCCPGSCWSPSAACCPGSCDLVVDPCHAWRCLALPQIPADMRLVVLKTATLRAEQSSLTGEPVAVLKGTEAIQDAKCELQVGGQLVGSWGLAWRASCSCRALG